MDRSDTLIHLIRKQRHDFMNDLQVIYGYIQIGKEGLALKYIEKISLENEYISGLYSLGDKYLAFCMELNIKKLRKNNIDVEVILEIESFNENFFDIDYSKKRDLVNNIFNEFERNKSECVYIYVFEDTLGQSILICDSESIIDELNWIESWNKINLNINNMNLDKCCYGNNIGYRITFI